MPDKLVFQTNIPVEVALKYGDGKDVTGQYGDQVLYTLTDGRVTYVPPIVRKQIEDLEIGRGELFTIKGREEERNAPNHRMPSSCQRAHLQATERRIRGEGEAGGCPSRETTFGSSIRKWHRRAGGVQRSERPIPQAGIGASGRRGRRR